MTEQQQIDSVLARIKARWRDERPLCVFCNHGVDINNFHLCHLIRRSEAIPGYSRFELQTMELNVAPGHPDCHSLYDDEPWNAVYLPGITKVLDRIKLIDEGYYNRLLNLYELYWPDYAICELQNVNLGNQYLKLFT